MALELRRYRSPGRVLPRVSSASAEDGPPTFHRPIVGAACPVVLSGQLALSKTHERTGCLAHRRPECVAQLPGSLVSFRDHDQCAGFAAKSQLVVNGRGKKVRMVVVVQRICSKDDLGISMLVGRYYGFEQDPIRSLLGTCAFRRNEGQWSPPCLPIHIPQCLRCLPGPGPSPHSVRH
jgi:hypothetical protein